LLFFWRVVVNLLVRQSASCCGNVERLDKKTAIALLARKNDCVEQCWAKESVEWAMRGSVVDLLAEAEWRRILSFARSGLNAGDFGCGALCAAPGDEWDPGVCF
jgi:hypothetical protein